MTTSIQQDLIRRIADILSEEPATIDPEAPLHTLGLDSMRMVEVIVFVENQFGVDLMGSGLRREDVASVAALARTVERRRTA
jgi:acyl carrier protein